MGDYDPVVIYWDDPDGPSDFTEVMAFVDAMEKVKELTKAGLNCHVFKLTETHFFKAVG